jgi:chorismate-pyruvate lyase
MPVKSVLLALLAIGLSCRAAAVRDLESRLDRGGSATEVLRGWCAEHAMADPPVVRAERDASVDKPADRDVRAQLGAAPGEKIRYRRVRLTCGAHVLSEADNWYRPGRLTAEMNRQLDQTDTPFGAVVRSLNFHRRTLGVAQAPDPHILVRYRAVLLDPQERPFSLVVESYTAALLDFCPGTPARASACSP